MTDLTDMPATQWLLQAAPLLARFKAEDRALQELHSAHVDTWMAAEFCEKCGDYFRLDQLVRAGPCHLQCAGCYREPEREVEDDAWMRG